MWTRLSKLDKAFPGACILAHKDGQLFVEIVIGATRGLRQFPAGRLPPIQLAHGLQLVPRALTVGGQLVLRYDSDPTHVRIFSRHRELRGDAPEQWTRYTDPAPPHHEWEYMSGPHSKRLARWLGARAIDIDDESHSA